MSDREQKVQFDLEIQHLEWSQQDEKQARRGCGGPLVYPECGSTSSTKEEKNQEQRKHGNVRKDNLEQRGGEVEAAG